MQLSSSGETLSFVNTLLSNGCGPRDCIPLEGAVDALSAMSHPD
jgi:hypothetical protein